MPNPQGGKRDNTPDKDDNSMKKKFNTSKKVFDSMKKFITFNIEIQSAETFKNIKFISNQFFKKKKDLDNELNRKISKEFVVIKSEHTENKI